MKRRSRRRSVPVLSLREQVIVRLQRNHGRLKCPKSRDFAADLLRQFRTKGFLTDKQWYYAQDLLKRPMESREKKKPASIYVIESGGAIKIGMGGSAEARRGDLQTARSNEAVVRFQRKIGSRDKTRSIEKKLHRFCQKYHIYGEWFALEAIPLVEQFFSTIEEKHKLSPLTD